MTDPSVRLDRSGHVAVLTVSNPEVRNALSTQMAQQLIDHCDELDRDPTVGAVVVCGDGKTFCSGADTRGWGDLYAVPSSDRAYAETDTMYESFYRVGTLKMPTICAVRGAAVGAGMNLALAADLRIVAHDARLMAGFLKAGIHPGGGFFTILSRVAGREAAAAMGVFSEEVSGARAVELGLAWQSCNADQVDERARELAERIAVDPLLARRVVKSFRAQADPSPVPWAAARELERGVQMWTQSHRVQSQVAEDR